MKKYAYKRNMVIKRAGLLLWVLCLVIGLPCTSYAGIKDRLSVIENELDIVAEDSENNKSRISECEKEIGIETDENQTIIERKEIRFGFNDLMTSGSIDDCKYCYEIMEGEKTETKPTVEESSSSGSENKKAKKTNYYSKNTIKHVQVALNSAGYDCGRPDGKKGPKTTAAIQSYQNDNGLKVTGKINGELLSALGLD